MNTRSDKAKHSHMYYVCMPNIRYGKMAKSYSGPNIFLLRRCAGQPDIILYLPRFHAMPCPLSGPLFLPIRFANILGT